MKYASIEWRNGQPYNRDYGDIYYSLENGLAESEYVFVTQNLVPETIVSNTQMVLFEAGFGTGLNFVLSVRHWLRHASQGSVLYYIAVENQPLSPEDMKCASETWPELHQYYSELLNSYPLLIPGYHNLILFNGRVHLQLIYMNVTDALRRFDHKVDVWYLDGFAPAKNPECWSQALMKEMARCSKPGSRVSTYTSAGAVVRALSAERFNVVKIPGHGRKRQMITAIYHGDDRPGHIPPWHQLPAVAIQDKKAVVIGAGLAGLTAAWALIRCGWEVKVVERNTEPAAEASGNGAGLLMPRLSIADSVDSMFYSNAFAHAVNMLEKLQQFTADTIWYGRGVYAVYDATKAQKLQRQYQSEPRFIACADEDISTLIKCSSNRKILYLEQAGSVSPKNICNAIIKACGNKLNIVHADIKQLQRKEGVWQLITKNGQPELCSSVVVLANASGISQFDYTSWLPVYASRGQITLVKANDNSRQLVHAMSADKYVTPACGGVHYVGASYSNEDLSLTENQQDHVDNLKYIDDCLPGMFQESEITGARVALRATSKDRVPVIGPVPDREVFSDLYHDLHHGKNPLHYPPAEYYPGLYVTTAHGSRGIASCFLSADIIAAMLDSRPMPVGTNIVQYLSATRFLIRELRRGPISCE